MKHYLNCPIKGCSFQIGVDYDASEAECVEVTTRFKNHLMSHDPKEIADTLFRLLMTLEERT